MAECRFHGECRLCGGLTPRECDGKGMVTTLSAVGYVYDRCSRFEPMPDSDELMKIADEMVEMFRIGAFTGEGIDRAWCRELHDKYARRIREALGVSA